MDPKATARAKRSHTQQGRKSHPTPSALAQKKKAAQGGPEEKVRRPHSQALRSNWDRYDDGKEEDESAGDSKLPEGEVAPKSKGANFAHLIEQARSQQREIKAPAATEPLSFFDELTLDLMQGVSSINAVRGKNILFRCEDDNFVVDDDLTPSFEVPFLNLDLNALDAQLSKIKLSDRLFLEPDLFPEDLSPGKSKGSSSSPQSETPSMIDPRQSPDGHQSPTLAQNISVFPSSVSSQPYPDHENLRERERETKESPTNMGKISTSKVLEAEADLDMLLQNLSETSISGSIHGDPLNTKTASEVFFHSSTTDTGLLKQPTEVELDDLLDSTDETALFGSKFESQNSNFLYPMHQKSPTQAQVSLKGAATASMDDSIDALLAETSPITASMDDSIDALLAETSPIQNRARPHSGLNSVDDLLAGTSFSRVQKPFISSNKPVSSAASQGVIDDYDSWIDTL